LLPKRRLSKWGVTESFQKGLIFIDRFCYRIVKWRRESFCLRKLLDEPVLKSLPEVSHIHIVRKWVSAEVPVKEALPEHYCFVGVVVPRLRMANLRLAESLLLGLSNGSANSSILICVVFWLVIEPYGHREYGLKHVGLHHHVGALTGFLAYGDDLMP
jgi:hypothetical protein